jgi:peptide/nickel transport system substrate-binding protein
LKKLCAIVAVLSSAVIVSLALAACGSGDSGGKDGGTLTGLYSSAPDYLDPALSYSQEGWTAMYNTYIPLLTYAHADGVGGGKVVPGLATALPKISDGGKTYTLFLRKGLMYSNGKPVKASDFTYAVERMFRLNSGGSGFYTDIAGAEKFAETKHGGIPGIETDDKTGEIVIHLVQPRGTFSNELGLMFVAPVPAGTPMEDLSADPPPATGPYMITKSRPGKGWEYARNPEWAKANGAAMPDLPGGHVDKIKITLLSNPSTEVNDIEQGRFDWMQAPPPPDRYAAVKQKYEGTQFRVEPGVNVYFFWMNTTRPPFDDVKVRQAVNYAINPEALERIYAGQLTASQQILPEGMPGHEKFELYPYDLAKAKALVEEADPSRRQVTVWANSEPENREATEYYAGVLKKIGLEPKLKVVNADNYFTIVGNHSTPGLDTGWLDWIADYPHPNDFFQPLLSTEALQETNNYNMAELDVPAFNRKIAQLGRETLGSEQEAEYAALDKGYMEQAPWAPYGSRTTTTFVSSAVDLESIIFNPTFGQDLTSFQFK